MATDDDAGSWSRPAPVLLVWAVVGVQVLLVLQFGVMGLGWGGALYTANVLQGLVLLVVAVLLAARRRLLVVLVPVVSVVLSLVLQGAGTLLTAQARSPGAKAAVVLEEVREAVRRTDWAFTGEQRIDRVEISDGRWTFEVEPRADDDVSLELVVRLRGR